VAGEAGQWTKPSSTQPTERGFGTWQGRLPQELRLAGITTMEGANAFPRGTLADSAVFIHQHLDESISIRYGAAPATTAVISFSKAQSKTKGQTKNQSAQITK
jgi:hypothetical protein